MDDGRFEPAVCAGRGEGDTGRCSSEALRPDEDDSGEVGKALAVTRLTMRSSTTSSLSHRLSLSTGLHIVYLSSADCPLLEPHATMEYPYAIRARRPFHPTNFFIFTAWIFGV